jgi:hypothetical protein
MHDVDKAQRHNRTLLAVNLVVFLGALSLIVVGYRSLAGWPLLVSSIINVMSALAGRRALSRVSAAQTPGRPLADER